MAHGRCLNGNVQGCLAHGRCLIVNVYGHTIWRKIHWDSVGCLVTGNSGYSLSIFASFSILQLIKERRDSGFLRSLPSGVQLEDLAYRVSVVGFIFWTFTLIAGAIWARQAWGAYWNWDPKEVWTFVIWVIYAAYLHARATAGWSLRTANLIAVVGYLAIIANFTIVNYYLPGMHSYSGLVTP